MDHNLVLENSSSAAVYTLPNTIIWSHLLKKSLIENFIFCAVNGLCGRLADSNYCYTMESLTCTKFSCNHNAVCVHITRTVYPSCKLQRPKVHFP